MRPMLLMVKMVMPLVNKKAADLAEILFFSISPSAILMSQWNNDKNRKQYYPVDSRYFGENIVEFLQGRLSSVVCCTYFLRQTHARAMKTQRLVEMRRQLQTMPWRKMITHVDRGCEFGGVAPLEIFVKSCVCFFTPSRLFVYYYSRGSRGSSKEKET